MLQILNLAIGLSFIFLLFSLVVAAINEAWLGFLDQRTRFLREGMRELFQEHGFPAAPGWIKSIFFKQRGTKPATADATKQVTAHSAASESAESPPPAAPPIAEESLLREFYEHGLINSLSRDANGRPAYIPAEMFVTALIDIIRERGAAVAQSNNQIAEGIKSIKNEHFKQALDALYQQVAGDTTKFEQAIKDWFNLSMDRVTGWYKRYAQQWLIALGFLVAIAANVDTIHIIKSLSTDPKLLQSTVDQAVAYSKANPTPAKTSDADKTQQNLDKLVQNTTDALNTLNGTSIPIGWSAAELRYFSDSAAWKSADLHYANILTAPLGWLLTAFAASLGASFWFDTLKQFVNIRSNGQSPAEIKAKALAASKQQ